MSLGGNCIPQGGVNQPTGPVVLGAVTLRNVGERAVHLVLLTEQAGSDNLVQPEATRTVDVNLAAGILDVVAFQPGNPQTIGAIECIVSQDVGGVITPTGVEIVWTGVGPSGFECR
jgi:hypothetical protein